MSVSVYGMVRHILWTRKLHSELYDNKTLDSHRVMAGFQHGGSFAKYATVVNPKISGLGSSLCACVCVCLYKCVCASSCSALQQTKTNFYKYIFLLTLKVSHELNSVVMNISTFSIVRWLGKAPHPTCLGGNVPVLKIGRAHV